MYASDGKPLPKTARLPTCRRSNRRRQLVDARIAAETVALNVIEAIAKTRFASGPAGNSALLVDDVGRSSAKPR